MGEEPARWWQGSSFKHEDLTLFSSTGRTLGESQAGGACVRACVRACGCVCSPSTEEAEAEGPLARHPKTKLASPSSHRKKLSQNQKQTKTHKKN